MHLCIDVVSGICNQDQGVEQVLGVWIKAVEGEVTGVVDRIFEHVIRLG